MHTAADTLSPALESLVTQYAAMVRKVAVRHGLAEDDIDEVFQDVRIRLWRVLEKREKSEPVPASYIYRTAMSAALDLIRRRRARREDSLDLEGTPQNSAADPRAEQALEVSELAEALAVAIDSLTASRRPVVRMHLAGYHRSEIAALLGWSEAKTRNLLYRGLEELRERLAERGIGPKETVS